MAKKKKRKSSVQDKMLMAFLLFASVVFLPSSMLLGIGMFPTIVATFVSRANSRSKCFAIGAMNLAGCFPFLLSLWLQEHTISRSLEIIAQPIAICVMYVGAGVGYLVFWSVQGVVANMLYQKGEGECDAMITQKTRLVERWGYEVTGEVKLNDRGFPIDMEVFKSRKKQYEQKLAEKQKKKKAAKTAKEAADSKAKKKDGKKT